MSGRREANINFKVTQEEKELLQKIAEEEGYSLSDLMRHMIRKFLNDRNLK